MQLLACFEKLFRAFQSRLICPLQRGADGDIRIEKLRTRNQRVNREEPAKRVAGKDAIRLDAVALLNLRNQFRLDKLQKIIGTAGGRKLSRVWPSALRRG